METAKNILAYVILGTFAVCVVGYMAWLSLLMTGGLLVVVALIWAMDRTSNP